MIDQLRNIVYDTNYTTLLPQGGYPVMAEETKLTPSIQTSSSGTTVVKSQTPSFWSLLFGGGSASTTKKQEENPIIANKDLKEQVKYLLALPDEEYSDRKLTQALRKYIVEVERHHTQSISDYKTHIAPSYRKVEGTSVHLSGMLGKSYYMQTYPSYLDALWTRDVFAFHGKRDMSFFIYPEDDSAMQAMLKQKATQLKSEMNESLSKGITLDTEIEIQYRDIDEIRQKLATREERYYETGYYTTIYDANKEKLDENGKKFEQKVA